MVIKNLCILVLWVKVASALEVLSVLVLDLDLEGSVRYRLNIHFEFSWNIPYG